MNAEKKGTQRSSTSVITTGKKSAAFALKELTADEEAKIGALVKKAVSAARD